MRLDKNSALRKRELRKQKLLLTKALAQAKKSSQPWSSIVHGAVLPSWMSHFLLSLFAIGFALMIGRAYCLATDQDNRLRAQLISANLPLDALSELVYQSDKLTSISENIESVSVAALRISISDTAKAASNAAEEFRARSKAWSELRGKIKNDQSTYDNLRSDISQVQALQKDEVIKLKKMLDEAQRPSIFADAFNMTLSFILGILGSIISSWLYESWKGKKWKWLDYF